ncbi:Uncharacterised protein [Serratia fonticola]|uniref:Uncharacterized protein n=1 Tax=Serratia fonticola TaxID=47917 RepID=A0A448T197_SERFO|nr:Uncharacterised protein [Serratia fonticola]
MEVGSLSDWISVIGTWLILYVAWLAYKKAPEWLGQKFDEESVSIGTEIHFLIGNSIYTYARRLKNLINHPNNRTFPYSKIIHEVIRYNGKLSVREASTLWLEFMYAYQFDAYSGIAEDQIKLTKNIVRFNFMGWEITDKKNTIVGNIINDINKVVDAKFKINNIILPLIESKKNFMYDSNDTDLLNNLKITSQQLYLIEQDLDKNLDRLLLNLSNYHSNKGDYFDYFSRREGFKDKFN